MAKDILTTTTATINNLLHTIAAFPAEKFNSIPFEGSWTAAQVADHILLSVSGIDELLHTNTTPTFRQPDENVNAIREIFLDFTIKMKSPDFVLPRNEPIEKAEMIKAWEDVKNKLTKSIQTLDLSETCIEFELPGSGMYTRTEWVWFAVYHTQRHTHQLKNIYEILAIETQPVS